MLSTSDSVLGPFSNQGGSWCGQWQDDRGQAPGPVPHYREIMQQAYFPATRGEHDATPQPALAAVCTSERAQRRPVTPAGCDPSTGSCSPIANGASAPANRAQFTQMEANFALFAGLGLQAFIETQVSDDTPFDRFLDRNPQAFRRVHGSTISTCVPQPTRRTASRA